MHYLLFYDKAPDHAEREGPFRDAHLAHVRAAVERGELILGGPLHDPEDGSNVLLFQAESNHTAEEFALADPYVHHGIVNRWRVRAWETVVGPLAARPITT